MKPKGPQETAELRTDIQTGGTLAQPDTPQIPQEVLGLTVGELIDRHDVTVEVNDIYMGARVSISFTLNSPDFEGIPVNSPEPRLELIKEPTMAEKVRELRSALKIEFEGQKKEGKLWSAIAVKCKLGMKFPEDLAEKIMVEGSTEREEFLNAIRDIVRDKCIEDVLITIQVDGPIADKRY